MRLTIASVDYNPPELTDQTPFDLAIIRQVSGPDRPDYWLGRLDAPLRWLDGNFERQVEHLIVCARWQGTQIQPRMRNLPVGIAYVTDPTQLDDASVSFDKCRYVAIGIAHETEGTAAPGGETPALAGSIGPAFGLGKKR